MQKFFFILVFGFLFGINITFSQQSNELVIKDTISTKAINPLAPSRAAFYSAIVPGLGQVYNKKYWKVPLIYAALGVAVYSFANSNKKYHQFRDAYKRRLEGYTDDQYSFLDTGRLVAGQKFYQRNRDLSAFFIAGIYILNILDANVDAHLLQFNVNDKLTVKPDTFKNDFNYQQNVAITINFHF